MLLKDCDDELLVGPQLVEADGLVVRLQHMTMAGQEGGLPPEALKGSGDSRRFRHAS